MKTTKQLEIDRNYQAFQKFLPQILIRHHQETALMRNEELLGFFSTPYEAIQAGRAQYSDGMFSIQKVEQQWAVDLGWHSRV